MSGIAVVGAGIVGLSTGYALMERGVPVRVFEQGVPGNGQSGGESRIFRHAHDDRRLVRAAVESRQVYDEWSAALGVELVSDDGAVAIGPSVDQRLPLLTELGVAARRIGPEELAGRLPLLAGYDGPAMLDERGGSIRTTAAVGALSAALGDRLVADEVLSVRPTGDGVEVRSGGATERFDRVVVCAGRGTAHLARTVGLSLPVRQAAHVRLTFRVRGEAPSRLATLQDSSGVFGETGVYAAPTPDRSGYAGGSAARLRPARTPACSPLPSSPTSPTGPRRTSAGRSRASTPTRSTYATAGSPRFPGARTGSPCGSTRGSSSRQDTTCSSRRRASAGGWRLRRTASRWPRTCVPKASSAPPERTTLRACATRWSA